MAKFSIAEAKTGRNEGLYANNPADRGGETYAGIARKHWPNWLGWIVIDEIKSIHLRGANMSLRGNWSVVNKYAKIDGGLALQDLVSNFYLQNFWLANNLDKLDSQAIANAVYDFGVNSGKARASDFLQDAYNNLNPGKPIANDKRIGKQTIAAINGQDPKKIYDEFKRLRLNFYTHLATDPTQAQFLKGWLKRLVPYEKG